MNREKSISDVTASELWFLVSNAFSGAGLLSVAETKCVEAVGEPVLVDYYYRVNLIAPETRSEKGVRYG